MESVIGSFYTLSACIDKVPLTIDEWESWNKEQAKYLAIYKNCRNAKIPEIESKVSVGDVEPVNAFLRERGFSIQLDPIKPDDLAIASVLLVVLKWLSKGQKTSIRWNSQSYSAVNLESGVEVVYCEGFERDAVAKIVTKNNDTVYMTTLAKKPTDSFDVFEQARKLIVAETKRTKIYEDRVIFPTVDLDTMPDISWIVGMSDKLREKWMIAQALQQTKVKMDEEGVTIKEAVTLGVRCMSASFPSKVPLIINEPFLFVVKREGLKEPLFSAYLDVDGWCKS